MGRYASDARQLLQCLGMDPEELCRRRAVQQRLKPFGVRILMAKPFIAHRGQAFTRSSIPSQGVALRRTLGDYDFVIHQ